MNKRDEYIANNQEITDWDVAAYQSLVSLDLTDTQIQQVVTPPFVLEKDEVVLAVHWHPEHVAMDLIEQRINAMFPNRRRELMIPTQHNQLMTRNGFTGVEVDCYSPEFNRKVQLLFHFEESKLEKADVLKSMLEHTHRYRSTQFYEFLETLLNPKFNDRIEKAVKETGAEKELVEFVLTYSKKLSIMVDRFHDETPIDAIKNKLLPNYFTMLQEFYDEHLISRALIFLKEVKKIVKKHFVLDYFYKTNEIIEEARLHNGGIVVPHPEQFWPVLLADYDVDGYEVWNPQSREFTDFLINVVNKKNRTREYQDRPLLVFMGDDTHMGEKTKDPRHQKAEKASREIGYQPAWDDLEIRKSLILANIDRERVIDEYTSRLQ